MAAIDDLINKIEDNALRERIAIEVDKLKKQHKFGLVFEEHLPECVPMYEIPIRQGCKVAVLDEQHKLDCNKIYFVTKIEGDMVSYRLTDSSEDLQLHKDRLVVVAECGEPIYPCLKPIDSICNAPDSDLWHTLIEADNYHALQLLEYLYAGKVDCIYIDPPYNTGAKDWKYNNNYVDSSDVYRHSKWLSMMEKRLKLAKKLLNPADSVLIVTIDEKEYLHLGCLLEEMFPEANIQMITDIINPKGVSRGSLFSRAEEYIYFVFMGNAAINLGTNDMLHSDEQKSSEIRWASLQRSGSNSRRFERPNLFYPIFFESKSGKFVAAGASLTPDQSITSVNIPEGQIAVFPLGKNNDERTWQLAQNTFLSLQKQGYVKFGNWQSNQRRTITYLSSGVIKQIENDEIKVVGYYDDGSVILEGESKSKPLSVWNKSSHSASDQGSSFISNILTGKRFPFPKSLYSTRDTLWFFVANKPDALILDFFAGSGTTLHAVNLLNAEDGGHRRCIMVTNNEISDAEEKEFTKKGTHKGDEEWEAKGIARYVTWPRTVCSIEGHDVNGNPLKGNYIGSGIPMADGFKANANYFKLGFLDKTSVSLGLQFKELLPLLWLKAGAVGPCPKIETEQLPPIFFNGNFAVLIDESHYADFAEQVNGNEKIEVAYIVTDSNAGYREMSTGLQVNDSYQLYKDYLDNFRINKSR